MATLRRSKLIEAIICETSHRNFLNIDGRTDQPRVYSGNVRFCDNRTADIAPRIVTTGGGFPSVLLFICAVNRKDENLGNKRSFAITLAAFATLGLWFSPLGYADDQAKKDDGRDQQEKIYELTSDITPPRLIHRVDPEYPSGSRGLRLEGSVIIESIITAHGEPTTLRVVKSLAEEVDKAALDAVKQWRFEPAKKDRKPVAVRVTIEVAFHAM